VCLSYVIDNRTDALPAGREEEYEEYFSTTTPVYAVSLARVLPFNLSDKDFP
jgi:hypothetical protein